MDGALVSGVWVVALFSLEVLREGLKTPPRGKTDSCPRSRVRPTFYLGRKDGVRGI